MRLERAAAENSAELRARWVQTYRQMKVDYTKAAGETGEAPAWSILYDEAKGRASSSYQVVDTAHGATQSDNSDLGSWNHVVGEYIDENDQKAKKLEAFVRQEQADKE